MYFTLSAKPNYSAPHILSRITLLQSCEFISKSVRIVSTPGNHFKQLIDFANLNHFVHDHMFLLVNELSKNNRMAGFI